MSDWPNDVDVAPVYLSCLFDLLGAVRNRIGRLKVIDVGAMAVDSHVVHARLLERDAADVVGFEAEPDECAKLRANAPPHHTFVECAVADGNERTFHRNAFAMTSSLYPPNVALQEQFENLAGFCEPKQRSPISTRRLDDIPEARGAHYLKLDVQGAELDVLANASKVLETCLMVVTEVAFVPVYEGQPLFADVDVQLRSSGFQFHRFLELVGRGFRPLKVKHDSPLLGQTLWADAVYVRDFLRFDHLEVDDLLRLAVLVELVGSHDLAHRALVFAQNKGGPALASSYLDGLTGPRRPEPRLDEF